MLLHLNSSREHKLTNQNEACHLAWEQISLLNFYLFLDFFGRFGSLHDYRSVFNFVKFTDFVASGQIFQISKLILGRPVFLGPPWFFANYEGKC